MTANADVQLATTGKSQDCAPVGWTIVAMCLISAMAILFNFFPDSVGVFRSLADPSSFTPILAQEFEAHMPWLNLLWTLQLSLYVVNLILRRWTTVTRWVDWALDILAAYIMARMVLGGPISVFPWLTMVAKLGLAVAIIVISVAAIARLPRLPIRPR